MVQSILLIFGFRNNQLMRLINKEGVGHHYINHLNVVLSNSRSQGIGDSLGRTARAAIVYDENRNDLIQGVRSFFVTAPTHKGYKKYVTRYPNILDVSNYARGNSRDHVVIAISCMKQLNQHEFVKDFIEMRAKRPCPDHSYTLGQRFWFKALYSKFWSWVYAIGRTPWLLLQALLNFIFRILSGTLKTWDNPKQFVYAEPKPLGRWGKFWYKLVLPTYASFYSIYAANAIDSKLAKKYLQLIMRLYFERNNYVARSLCGQNIKRPLDYTPSRSNRWSTRLDRGCDRDMSPYEDPAYTNVELGMLLHYCS